MSSDADHEVFNACVEPQDNTTLFASKKWQFIPDSNSQSGKFTTMHAYNLNLFANLDRWVGCGQLLEDFPIHISLKNISNANIVGTYPCTVGMDTACIKNGFHQFTHQLSCNIGSTEIQTPQNYENVNTTFKQLTQWDINTYKKLAPTLGLGIDDFALSADGSPTAYTGLDNEPSANTILTKKGFTIPVNRNAGFKERIQNLNGLTKSTTTANTILNTPHLLGKPQVYINTTPSAGGYAFDCLMRGLVRMSDQSDALSKMPFIKNLKGLLTVFNNGGIVRFTTDKLTGAIKSVDGYESIAGLSFPAMLGNFVGGRTTGVGEDAQDVQWEFRCCVEGITDNTDTGAPKLPYMEGRLWGPYYEASPAVDKALSMQKVFRYNERVVHDTATVSANSSWSGIATIGIPNPKRVFIHPIFIGEGKIVDTDGTTPIPDGDVRALRTNPLISPFSHESCGSSPFAGINNLQIMVANKPIFQNPVNMDWLTFKNEIAESMGNNGGMDNMEGSGLLNQRLWQQLYRFYTADLSRRLEASDGANVGITYTLNNICKVPMKPIWHIWYEKELKVDTVLGTVSVGFAT